MPPDCSDTVSTVELVSGRTVAYTRRAPHIHAIQTGMVFYRTENTAVFFDIDADGTNIPCCIFKALERERAFFRLFEGVVANLERHATSS